MAVDYTNAPIMDDPSGTFSDPGDPTDDLTNDLGSDISAWSYQPGWLDNIWSAIGSDTAKNLLNLGSGVYGLTQAQKMKNLAKDAYTASDPFGPQRAQYAKQLQDLMKDPSSLKDEPGYKFQEEQGEQAVTRQMAAKGYLGSGNMGVALTEYGQGFANNYLNQRISTLSQLAGAGISPSFGASLSGYASGIDTASQALASLGYGSVMAGEQPSKPSRPNSAGGEAAKIGGLASTAGKLASGLGAKQTGSTIGNVGGVISGVAKGGVSGYTQAASSAVRLGETAFGGGSVASRVGANGPDASGIGYVTPTAGTGGVDIGGALSTAGNVAGIYTGIREGDVGGYAKAGSSLASLAGYDVPGMGYIDAAQKLSKGNVGGAGYSAMITAAGPVAMLGSAIADLANKSFTGHGDESRNFAAFLANFPGTEVYQLAGRSPRQYVKLDDGKLIDYDTFKDLSGKFYGAAYAPDGNQADWQKQYMEAVSSLKSTTAPLYVKDGLLYSSINNKVMGGQPKKKP